MILIAGTPTESPIALVLSALDDIGAGYRVLDQRQRGAHAMTLEITDECAGGAIGGRLRLPDGDLDLATVTGAYCRLVDLPVAVDPGDASAPGLIASDDQRIPEMISVWMDVAPGRMLNRPSAMASNHSKPYQAHAIQACGFLTPETLITTDPEAATTFIEARWRQEREVIYKSISGVRSIVQCVARADLKKLDRIRWCPTQFQERVDGTDIRVHTVGEEVFAVEISSAAVDYRYAERQTGEGAALSAVELPPDVARRCLDLSRRLQLPLAGIDLRRTAAGEYYCFEANPSPAFSYYEGATGLPISTAIARHLADAG
jgi:hypothetical protein